MANAGKSFEARWTIDRDDGEQTYYPAPPRIRLNSGERVVRSDMRKLYQCLIDQSVADAHARGDELDARMFASETPKNFPQASSDLCNLYLFGELYPEWDTRTGERIQQEQ